MSKSIWFQPLSIEDFKDSSINMDKHLGIEIVEIGDDFIVGRMPVIEKTKQPMEFFMEVHPVFLLKALAAQLQRSQWITPKNTLLALRLMQIIFPLQPMAMFTLKRLQCT